MQGGIAARRSGRARSGAAGPPPLRGPHRRLRRPLTAKNEEIAGFAGAPAMPTGRKLLRGKDVGTLETNEKLLPTLTADERLISLGGPIWTVARKASAVQVRHGLSNFR